MKNNKTLDEAYMDLYKAWNEFKEEIFKPIRTILLKIVNKLNSITNKRN